MLTVLFTVIYLYIFLEIIGLISRFAPLSPYFDLLAIISIVISFIVSVGLAHFTVRKIKGEK